MSNCAHPVREILDNIKIIDSKGMREYHTVKCMVCDHEFYDLTNVKEINFAKVKDTSIRIGRRTHE